MLDRGPNGGGGGEVLAFPDVGVLAEVSRSVESAEQRGVRELRPRGPWRLRKIVGLLCSDGKVWRRGGSGCSGSRRARDARLNFSRVRPCETDAVSHTFSL